MAQRQYVEPRKYVIGEDLPREQYEEALVKIADWFAESRRTKEPAILARQLIQECLDGVTRDGKPWFAAAMSTMAARIKIKCRFDIDTMKPLRKGSEKTRKKKEQERARTAKRRKKAREDDLIPDEIRKDLAGSAKYGEDANILLSSAEERRWRTLRDAYTVQFPELATVNAEAELQLLCDLHIMSERQRMKALKGEKVDPRNQGEILAQVQNLKKALGIHPDQLAKRASTKVDVSIGAAAARLDSLENYHDIRARFWIEEMLQVFQMYHSLRADGLNYQLDEVGLFGMTRCRTCACAQCGQRNFVGISIEEVEQYLVSKGAMQLVEEEDAETGEASVVTADPGHGE